VNADMFVVFCVQLDIARICNWSRVTG